MNVLKQAREALGPFAAIADWHEDMGVRDDAVIHGFAGPRATTLTLGQCRRARAALAALDAAGQAVARIDATQPPATMAEQVRRQYLAVAHMARALASVHEDIAPSICMAENLVKLRGQRSAELMYLLGDILNGMDAVDAGEDGWLDPIFDAAHEMFPPAAGQAPASASMEVTGEMVAAFNRAYNDAALGHTDGPLIEGIRAVLDLVPRAAPLAAPVVPEGLTEDQWHRFAEVTFRHADRLPGWVVSALVAWGNDGLRAVAPSVEGEAQEIAELRAAIMGAKPHPDMTHAQFVAMARDLHEACAQGRARAEKAEAERDAARQGYADMIRYTRAAGYAEGVEAAAQMLRERAGKRPCDCIEHEDGSWQSACYCMNGGDADSAAQWCEAMNAAEGLATLLDRAAPSADTEGGNG